MDVAKGYSGIRLVKPSAQTAKSYNGYDAHALGKTLMERLMTSRSAQDVKREVQGLGWEAMAVVSDRSRRTELWQQTQYTAKDASGALQRLKSFGSWEEYKERMNEHMAAVFFWIRRHVTGGYWVEVEMEPKVSILRQARVQSLET